MLDNPVTLEQPSAMYPLSKEGQVVQRSGMWIKVLDWLGVRAQWLREEHVPPSPFFPALTELLHRHRNLLILKKQPHNGVTGFLMRMLITQGRTFYTGQAFQTSDGRETLVVVAVKQLGSLGLSMGELDLFLFDSQGRLLDRFGCIGPDMILGPVHEHSALDTKAGMAVFSFCVTPIEDVYSFAAFVSNRFFDVRTKDPAELPKIVIRNRKFVLQEHSPRPLPK